MSEHGSEVAHQIAQRQYMGMTGGINPVQMGLIDQLDSALQRYDVLLEQLASRLATVMTPSPEVTMDSPQATPENRFDELVMGFAGRHRRLQSIIDSIKL